MGKITYNHIEGMNKLMEVKKMYYDQKMTTEKALRTLASEVHTLSEILSKLFKNT